MPDFKKSPKIQAALRTLAALADGRNVPSEDLMLEALEEYLGREHERNVHALLTLPPILSAHLRHAKARGLGHYVYQNPDSREISLLPKEGYGSCYVRGDGTYSTSEGYILTAMAT